MVHFHLVPNGLAGIQLAYSPIWECLISIRRAQARTCHPLHRAWADQVRPAISRAGLELLPVLVRPGGYIPDFLAPPPAGPSRGFQEELEQLRLTPLALMRADLTRAARGSNGADVQDLLGRYVGREPALLRALVLELEHCWACLLDRHWPRLEAFLAGEVLRRAHQLACKRPAEALAAMHPAIKWRANGLQVDHTGRKRIARVGTEGLLLVPSVFAWPDVFTVTDRPWRLSIYYPAGGAGDWFDPPAPLRGDPLAALVGRSRARVLRHLSVPVTTLELAARLQVRPSAVSRHLTGLATAGLANRVRIGKRVVYSPGLALRSLLDLIDSANSSRLVPPDLADPGHGA